MSWDLGDVSRGYTQSCELAAGPFMGDIMNKDQAIGLVLSAAGFVVGFIVLKVVFYVIQRLF